MNDRAKFDDPHLESLLPKIPFSRRGFIASSFASGFALAAGPVAAQTVIKTPTDRLDVGNAQVPVSGGNLPVYFAAPQKTGARPVVMVIPEIWGLHEYQRDMCRRLAKAGYYGVSFDPYFRQGELWKMTDIKQVLGLAFSLNDAQAYSDMDALVAWLGSQPKANLKKLGVTGMCIGGRMTWMYTAHNPRVKAAVAWYGHFIPRPPAMMQTPIDVADQLKAPVLGLYAGEDNGIPLDQVERMRAALVAFGKEKESMIHVYQGMPHAFHADYRPTYRKEAADDGWKRMLAWFKKNGVA